MAMSLLFSLPPSRVDSELDLIKTQQAELEDLLGSMEKLVDQLPLSTEGQHADHMRNTDVREGGRESEWG